MNWLDRIPLSAFVRLLGAIVLGGAIYAAVTSGLRPGWFSTPSIFLGCLSGPGLLLYRRWARPLGISFFILWLLFGLLILLAGPHPTRGLPLVISALSALPVLRRWSDDVSITKD